MRSRAASLRQLACVAWESVCQNASLGTVKTASPVAILSQLRPAEPTLRTSPLNPPFSTQRVESHRHGVHPQAASTRGFATSPPGADLAQRVLSAADPADLGEATPLLSDLEPAGLPAVARAAVVTGVTDRSFRDALVDSAVRGMPSLSPAALCSVVESLAELGAYSVAFKDATADQVLAKLEEFSGDMLGHTLRAFGSMQYYDDELLEGVVAHVASVPEKFSAENIADVVYAFSKCGFCHPDLVTMVERAAGVLVEEAAHDRGEAIASIVDAYSRVGCSEPDILDELVGRVSSNPSALSGEALAKLIVAIIRLGGEDQKQLATLLDAVVGKLNEVTPKSIVKMLCALGELGQSHQGLLDAVTERQVPERMSEFSPAGLCDLVNALNKVGYYNSKFMGLLHKQGVAVAAAEGAQAMA